MFRSVNVAGFSFAKILANLASWPSTRIYSKSYIDSHRSPKHDNSVRCDNPILEHSNVVNNGDRDLFGSAAEGSELALLEDLLAACQIENPTILAQRILLEFESIPKFFDASDKRLRLLGIDNPTLRWQLLLIKKSLHHYLKPKKIDRVNVKQYYQLSEYLTFRHGYLDFEQARVIFTDIWHNIIKDELMGTGTPTEVAIYTRNVLQRALELSATGIILVHNHPADTNPKPSNADIETTRNILHGCGVLDISLIDHIIISKNNHFSFRLEKLL